MTNRLLWGVLWRSENKLDGNKSHLVNQDRIPVLFRTRKEARYFIKRYYGYIKGRKDLQAEPHGWKMPTPVRVKTIVAEGK